MADCTTTGDGPIEAPSDGRSLAPHRRGARELSEAAADRRLRREARLRDLGYEESTLDEEREAIGRNVAMLEWPK